MVGMKKGFWLCVVAAANVAVAGRVFGVVHYVENYGDDLNPCTFGSPCRSITQGVLAASEGDVILVGPGAYGDLNRDGVDDAGEDANGVVIGTKLTVVARRGPATTVIEGPTAGPAVRIAAKGVVLKGFTIVARNTATDDVVVIDAAPAAISKPIIVVGNYLAGAGGVTPTGIRVAQSLDPAGTYAVLQANQIDGMDVGVSIDNSKRATVAANTITASGTSIILGVGDNHVVTANQIAGAGSGAGGGILVSTGQHHVIAANVVRGLGGAGAAAFYVTDLAYAVTLAANQAYGPQGSGFLIAGSGHVVKGNVASGFTGTVGTGFVSNSSDSQFIANVASRNDSGFVWGFTLGPPVGTGNTMIGCSAVGNFHAGIRVLGANALLSVKSSNIFDNGRSSSNPSCGLVNDTASTIIATNNFWGSAAGPGTVPANLACNTSTGSVTTSPFSTVRFP